MPKWITIYSKLFSLKTDIKKFKFPSYTLKFQVSYLISAKTILIETIVKISVFQVLFDIDIEQKWRAKHSIKFWEPKCELYLGSQTWIIYQSSLKCSLNSFQNQDGYSLYSVFKNHLILNFNPGIKIMNNVIWFLSLSKNIHYVNCYISNMNNFE